jgi:hypothetical protein
MVLLHQLALFEYIMVENFFLSERIAEICGKVPYFENISSAFSCLHSFVDQVLCSSLVTCIFSASLLLFPWHFSMLCFAPVMSRSCLFSYMVLVEMFNHTDQHKNHDYSNTVTNPLQLQPLNLLYTHQKT